MPATADGHLSNVIVTVVLYFYDHDPDREYANKTMLQIFQLILISLFNFYGQIKKCDRQSN